MTLSELIRAFTADQTVQLVAGLILLDFVLGMSAGVKAGTFRFGWIADFLRNDVLGKVVPYFAVWGAVRVGGDFELAGFGMIEETVGAAVVLALGASVLNSLRDLSILPASTPNEVAGSDEPPPVP
jgi:hypothetical protein